MGKIENSKKSFKFFGYNFQWKISKWVVLEDELLILQGVNRPTQSWVIGWGCGCFHHQRSWSHRRKCPQCSSCGYYFFSWFRWVQTLVSMVRLLRQKGACWCSCNSKGFGGSWYSRGQRWRWWRHRFGTTMKWRWFFHDISDLSWFDLVCSWLFSLNSFVVCLNFCVN